mmetsp:Transcript_53949/g.97127  ORF Transcript_53949/g.97127 Transcript_53949/m.97127 type:complete len:104 (+) Transcript_53949:586-897(+)
MPSTPDPEPHILPPDADQPPRLLWRSGSSEELPLETVLSVGIGVAAEANVTLAASEGAAAPQGGGRGRLPCRGGEEGRGEEDGSPHRGEQAGPVESKRGLGQQ